jgi:putative aminopeptidase FrvX
MKEARMKVKQGMILGACLLAVAAAGLAAEVADSRAEKDQLKKAEAVLREIFPIPAMTGNEELLAAKIRQILAPAVSFEQDNLGGLYAKIGAGAGGLAILAPLDEFGYVVSGITDDGFLTVDRPTPLPVPIYDSFLLGHPAILSTRKGLQHGVIVQPSMHVLTRERREQLANNLTLDLIFVDVGARSKDEARAKAIEILDPMTPWPDLVTLANGRLAGPALGQKAACAALAAAASDLASTKPPAGATLVWMAQTRFGARGERASLGAVRARNKLSPKAVLLFDVAAADRGEKGPVLGAGPVLSQAKDGPSSLKDAVEAAAGEKGISLQRVVGLESSTLAAFTRAGVDAVVLALPVKFAGTPSEVIELKDIQRIADIVSAVVESGRVR